MKFIYRPEGMEPREWQFEPGKMLVAEATAIERLTKMRFAEWREEVVAGSMVALHGLLYVLLKRENVTLTPKQVVFSQDECDFEMEDDEIASMVKAMEGGLASGELDEDQEKALEALKRGLAERGYTYKDDAGEGSDDDGGDGEGSGSGEPDPTEPAGQQS